MPKKPPKQPPKQVPNPLTYRLTPANTPLDRMKARLDRLRDLTEALQMIERLQLLTWRPDLVPPEHAARMRADLQSLQLEFAAIADRF